MRICDLSFPPGCDVCAELELAHGDLNLPVGLTPATTPYLFVVDKFGNVYREQVTIGLDGSADMDPAEYPDGFFDQASSFKVFFSDETDGDPILPVTIDAEEFNCIKITIDSCFPKE